MMAEVAGGQHAAPSPCPMMPQPSAVPAAGAATTVGAAAALRAPADQRSRASAPHTLAPLPAAQTTPAPPLASISAPNSAVAAAPPPMPAARACPSSSAAVEQVPPPSAGHAPDAGPVCTHMHADQQRQQQQREQALALQPPPLGLLRPLDLSFAEPPNSRAAPSVLGGKVATPGTAAALPPPAGGAAECAHVAEGASAGGGEVAGQAPAGEGVSLAEGARTVVGAVPGHPHALQAELWYSQQPSPVQSDIQHGSLLPQRSMVPATLYEALPWPGAAPAAECVARAGERAPPPGAECQAALAPGVVVVPETEYPAAGLLGGHDPPVAARQQWQQQQQQQQGLDLLGASAPSLLPLPATPTEPAAAPFLEANAAAVAAPAAPAVPAASAAALTALQPLVTAQLGVGHGACASAEAEAAAPAAALPSAVAGAAHASPRPLRPLSIAAVTAATARRAPLLGASSSPRAGTCLPLPPSLPEQALQPMITLPHGAEPAPQLPLLQQLEQQQQQPLLLQPSSSSRGEPSSGAALSKEHRGMQPQLNGRPGGSQHAGGRAERLKRWRGMQQRSEEPLLTGQAGAWQQQQQQHQELQDLQVDQQQQQQQRGKQTCPRKHQEQRVPPPSQQQKQHRKRTPPEQPPEQHSRPSPRRTPKRRRPQQQQQQQEQQRSALELQLLFAAGLESEPQGPPNPQGVCLCACVCLCPVRCGMLGTALRAMGSMCARQMTCGCAYIEHGCPCACCCQGLCALLSELLIIC